MKNQDPKTIVRLFLYSIHQEHYETTYHFYTTLYDEEDKKMFLKSANLKTGNYYARIKLPSFFYDKYSEMTQKDGIWLINEAPINMR
ncbi:hypothetical protein [Bacillus mycoides]|uniref:hypothetical protein n=1 Tax=Bacillus mycoides TaxID=1405 RepID=UPI00355796A7